MISIIMPTPLANAYPPFNIILHKRFICSCETNSLVNSLGPMVELSVVELAEMVINAFKKSAVELCLTKSIS